MVQNCMHNDAAFYDSHESAAAQRHYQYALMHITATCIITSFTPIVL